jgi:hypothetical protein
VDRVLAERRELAVPAAHVAPPSYSIPGPSGRGREICTHVWGIARRSEPHGLLHQGVLEDKSARVGQRRAMRALIFAQPADPLPLLSL